MPCTLLSSSSNQPNTEPAAQLQCNWKYDTLCSLAYTRKVLGVVATAMLEAADEAKLQEIFALATFREFYTQAEVNGDMGFCTPFPAPLK